jgi:hypothetical protein
VQTTNRAQRLQQPNQPPLPVRVAVDVTFRRLDGRVPGEQLDVTQAASGAMDVAGRRRDECAPP